jgi:hypothetical protein
LIKVGKNSLAEVSMKRGDEERELRSTRKILYGHTPQKET